MKFKIEDKPKVAAINKCIRFPEYLVKEINKAKGKNITFSKFVIEACNFALQNIEKED